MITWFQSSPAARRAFCSRCGGQLFWDREASDMVSIFAGGLDSTDGLTTSHHIHAASKAGCFEIGDDVPIWLSEAE